MSWLAIVARSHLSGTADRAAEILFDGFVLQQVRNQRLRINNARDGLR